MIELSIFFAKKNYRHLNKSISVVKISVYYVFNLIVLWNSTYDDYTKIAIFILSNIKFELFKANTYESPFSKSY